ncbi:protein kinase domain-containing protein [Corallococcus interemptor]|uniref:serine/threonine-protein kinase n=1 Tax=Corallococcus interemptor TaxID=2316720 RepID=UPI003D009AB0
MRKTASAETTPLVDPLLSSQIGDFTVEERIGAGGMGVVYRATHSLIGKQAAIKVLRAELVSPRVHERLLVEARAVNAIRHPGIIDIFGFGKLPDGRPYVVMELLEGRPLSELMSDQKRLDVPTVLWMLDQILSALGAAHRAGVVHRDLKPANVFMVEPPNAAPSIKLVDFGIAKLLENKESPTTVDGSVLGTPEFMAPEQIRGGAVGPATDLYALGIMAFQMLTGVRPFQGDPVQVLFAHVDKIPPLPSSRAEGIPPELDTLVLQLLAKDPALRPPSAEAVQQQLQRVPAESRTQTFAKPPGLKPKAPTQRPAPVPKPAVARVPTRAPAAVVEDDGTETLQALQRPPRRGWMIGGAALLLGLGAGAWWLNHPAAPVKQVPAQTTSEPNPRPRVDAPSEPPSPPKTPEIVVTAEKEEPVTKPEEGQPDSEDERTPLQPVRKSPLRRKPQESSPSEPDPIPVVTPKAPIQPQGNATVTDVTETEGTKLVGTPVSSPEQPTPTPVVVAARVETRVSRPELPQGSHTQRLLAKRLDRLYEALYARSPNGNPPPALLNSLLTYFQEAASTETAMEADRVLTKVELWERRFNQLLPSTNAPIVASPPPPIPSTVLPGPSTPPPGPSTPLPAPHAIPSGPRPLPRRTTAEEVKLADRLEQCDREFRRRTEGASDVSGLEWELWKFHERASQDLTADERGKLYIGIYKWMDVLTAHFPR